MISLIEYIDSEGNNLGVRDDIIIEELAKTCYLERGCEGFNANGDMKQTIRDSTAQNVKCEDKIRNAKTINK